MISSLTLVGLPAMLRREFGDRALGRVTQAVGIDLEALDGAHCFIPHAAVSAFISASARAIGDAHFGLHLAPRMTMEAYGVLARYVLQAETLGDAIARSIDVLPYHSTGDAIGLRIVGDEARYEYRFALAGRPGHEHVAPASAGVLSSLCRLYGPPGWRPLRIELDTPGPRCVTEFEDVFGCEVIFDAPAVSIVLPRHKLFDRRRSGRSSGVTRGDIARDRNGRAPRSDWEVIVEQMRVQVRSGSVSVERMAFAMNTSTRSLQRKFNREGTDFRTLARALRMDRAREMLRGADGTITEIAMELGYSTPANFTRAFRAASGTTPFEFRRDRTRTARLAGLT